MQHEGAVSAIGIISNQKIRTSKNGNQFAIASFEDMHGSVEAIFFPNVFQKYKNLLKGMSRSWSMQHIRSKMKNAQAYRQ